MVAERGRATRKEKDNDGGSVTSGFSLIEFAAKMREATRILDDEPNRVSPAASLQRRGRDTVITSSIANRNVFSIKGITSKMQEEIEVASINPSIISGSRNTSQSHTHRPLSKSSVTKCTSRTPRAEESLSNTPVSRSSNSNRSTARSPSIQSYQARFREADQALDTLRAELRATRQPVTATATEILQSRVYRYPPRDKKSIYENREDTIELKSSSNDSVHQTPKADSSTSSQQDLSTFSINTLDPHREQELRLAAEDKIGKLYMKISDLDHKLAVVEEHCRNERKSKNEVQAKIVKLENDEQRLASKLYQAEKAKTEAEERLVAMVERMSDMDHKLATTEEKLNATLKVHQKEIEEKAAQNKELKDKLKASEKALSRSRKEVRAVKDDSDSKSKCVAMMRQLVEEKEKEIVLRTKEWEAKDSVRFKQLEHMKKKYQRQVAQLQQRVEEKEKQLTKLKGEHRAQQQSLSTNTLQNKYLLSSLEKIREQCKKECLRRVAAEGELRALRNKNEATSKGSLPSSIAVRPKPEALGSRKSSEGMSTTASMTSSANDSTNAVSQESDLAKPVNTAGFKTDEKVTSNSETGKLNCQEESEQVMPPGQPNDPEEREQPFDESRCDISSPKDKESFRVLNSKRPQNVCSKKDTKETHDVTSSVKRQVASKESEATSQEDKRLSSLRGSESNGERMANSKTWPKELRRESVSIQLEYIHNGPEKDSASTDAVTCKEDTMEDLKRKAPVSPRKLGSIANEAQGGETESPEIEKDEENKEDSGATNDSADEGLSSSQQEHEENILASIPIHIKDMYQQVGFFKDRLLNEYFPILCLQPFSMPPGPAQLQVLREPNDFVGVYIYGKSSYPKAYQSIKWFRLIPYDAAVKRGLDKVPEHILAKLEKTIPLSPWEQELYRGLQQVKIAAARNSVDRAHPFLKLQRDAKAGPYSILPNQDVPPMQQKEVAKQKEEELTRPKEVRSPKKEQQEGRGCLDAKGMRQVLKGETADAPGTSPISTLEIDERSTEGEDSAKQVEATILPPLTRSKAATTELQDVVLSLADIAFPQPHRAEMAEHVEVINTIHSYLLPICSYDNVVVDTENESLKKKADNAFNKILKARASFDSGNAQVEEEEQLTPFQKTFVKTRETFAAVMQQFNSNAQVPVSMNTPEKKKKNAKESKPLSDIPEYIVAEPMGVEECLSEIGNGDIGFLPIPMDESDKLIFMLQQILGDDGSVETEQLGLIKVKSLLSAQSQEILDTVGYPSDEFKATG